MKRILVVVMGGLLIAAMLAIGGGPAIAAKAGGATLCAGSEEQAQGANRALQNAIESGNLVAVQQTFDHAKAVLTDAAAEGCTGPAVSELTAWTATAADLIGGGGGGSDI